MTVDDLIRALRKVKKEQGGGVIVGVTIRQSDGIKGVYSPQTVSSHTIDEGINIPNELIGTKIVVIDVMWD